MKERQSFPECDGHIESILIGCGVVKVSFQTWDCKKLVLIYRDVESVAEKNSVFGDISLYEEKRLDGGLTEYSFWGRGGYSGSASESGFSEHIRGGRTTPISTPPCSTWDMNISGTKIGAIRKRDKTGNGDSMRMRKKAWARPELASAPIIFRIRAGCVAPGWNGTPSAAPLHIELGCGKGVFTSEIAAANPGN